MSIFPLYLGYQLNDETVKNNPHILNSKILLLVYMRDKDLCAEYIADAPLVLPHGLQFNPMSPYLIGDDYILDSLVGEEY